VATAAVRERPAPVFETAEPPPSVAAPPRAEPPPPPARQAPPPRPAPPPPAPPLPAGDRFGRVPWPAGTEVRWRCEITRHLGLVHADFRAVAHEPGRRRPVEIARTCTHTRPGWGVEAPEAELTDAVQELASALRHAGWEPVRQGRDWFAARFVWLRPEPPVLDLPDLVSAAKEQNDDDA
jgi:hypothetical protein